MCLAVPARVESLPYDGQAVVETFGVSRTVATDLLPEKLDIGDYVLVHVGFAIRKIDIEQAQKTLALHQEIMENYS